jgi:hypothetical protein
MWLRTGPGGSCADSRMANLRHLIKGGQFLTVSLLACQEGSCVIKLLRLVGVYPEEGYTASAMGTSLRHRRLVTWVATPSLDSVSNILRYLYADGKCRHTY